MVSLTVVLAFCVTLTLTIFVSNNALAIINLHLLCLSTLPVWIFSNWEYVHLYIRMVCCCVCICCAWECVGTMPKELKKTKNYSFHVAQNKWLHFYFYFCVWMFVFVGLVRSIWIFRSLCMQEVMWQNAWVLSVCYMLISSIMFAILCNAFEKSFFHWGKDNNWKYNGLCFSANAGASWVGGKERVCVLPEGERVSTFKGDTFIATHQSDSKLCERVGADCVEAMSIILFALLCDFVATAHQSVVICKNNWGRL